MFGTDHKDHKFEHLEAVYTRHLKRVRDEAACIKSRLASCNVCMEALEHTLEAIQNAKDDKAREIATLVEQIYTRLDEHMKGKLMTLLAHKAGLAEEIEYLVTVEGDLNRDFTKTSKSVFVARSPELLNTLSEIQSRPLPTFSESSVPIDFP